jgi:hypothetical protein
MRVAEIFLSVSVWASMNKVPQNPPFEERLIGFYVGFYSFKLSEYSVLATI